MSNEINGVGVYDENFLSTSENAPIFLTLEYAFNFFAVNKHAAGVVDIAESKIAYIFVRSNF